LLTLAMIVLLALLIFGLVASMRTERETARAYNEETKVRWIADMALQDALAHLAAATPPITTTNTWIAAPGLIYQAQPGLLTNAPLYNANTDKSNLVDAAKMQNNLNLNGLVCGVNATYSAPGYNYSTDWASQSNRTFYGQPTGPYIAAGWVNIGENGNLPGTTNANGSTNPIVGRYTYWMDPESCKVNLNRAGSRNPTNANQSLPADLALRGLGGVFATDANVTNFLSAARNFTTPEEMRLARSPWPALFWDQFSSNKFAVTTYGSDANTDAFGRSRTNLNSATMAWTNLSLFSDTRWATMLYSNQVTDTARNTLVGKYGRFGVAQIMANILEYKNANGATTAPVGSEDRDSDEIPRFYTGLKKGPMINAVIVHVATNAVPNTTNTEVHCYVDVKLVNGYDGGTRGAGWWVKTEPATIEVKYVLPPSVVELTTNFPTPLAEKQYQLVNGMPTNSFGLLGSDAGDLADMGVSPVLSSYAITLDGSSNTTNLPPRVSQVTAKLKRVRLLMTNDPNYVVDWMAPVDFSNQTAGVGFVFGTNGVTGSGIVPNPPTFSESGTNATFMPIALVKQDPRVRTPTDWTTAAGNFASNAVNRLWENWGVYPNADHVVRTDANSFGYDSRQSPGIYGLLADTRVRPGSTATSPSQQFFTTQIAEREFQSVGELGYIHTGYPWRTIRLRSVRPETGSNTNWTDIALTGNYRGIGDPNTLLEHVETNALPDWVMLDMFTATNATSVAGRINLNNQFANAAVSASVPARTGPLAALLYNTSTGINANVDLIASNIANRVFVTNSPYASLPVYLTPGQVCEVSGLGYYSDVTWHPSSADREQAVRRLGNLITTRSDVFTIWIIAEYVRDLNKDGTFDWVYGIKYRFWQTLAWAQSNVHANVDTTWWNNKVLNTTNVRATVVDGDGNGKLNMDEIIGRVRIQAVVERYFDADAKPKYRVLYTRAFPNVNL
jgi:hypothetical protein